MLSQRILTSPSHQPPRSQSLCPSHPPAPSQTLNRDTSVSLSSARTPLHPLSLHVNAIPAPTVLSPHQSIQPNMTTPNPKRPHSTSRTSGYPTVLLTTLLSNHSTDHHRIPESTTAGLRQAIVTCRCDIFQSLRGCCSPQCRQIFSVVLCGAREFHCSQRG